MFKVFIQFESNVTRFMYINFQFLVHTRLHIKFGAKLVSGYSEKKVLTFILTGQLAKVNK